MPAFKFDSQSAFLTYAQCDASIQEIYDFLNGIKPLDWARVCRERHEDGNYHLHAVCKWTGRIQSRNERLFDWNGKHPNIQPVRSVKNALKYVAKDGEFSDFGSVPACAGTDIDFLAAAATLSQAEYYKLALKHRLPYQYASKFWELGKRNDGSEIEESYEADLTREHMYLNMLALPDAKTIVISGRTGLGKTSWAKRVCPKPALWVRHLDVLRSSFRPGYHKSIIIDELRFTHLPRETQIFLTDWTDDSHIHCRYGYATIPAGTIKIFTCNEKPEDWPFLDDPAINRRIHAIKLDL